MVSISSNINQNKTPEKNTKTLKQQFYLIRIIKIEHEHLKKQCIINKAKRQNINKYRDSNKVWVWKETQTHSVNVTVLAALDNEFSLDQGHSRRVV